MSEKKSIIEMFEDLINLSKDNEKEDSSKKPAITEDDLKNKFVEIDNKFGEMPDFSSKLEELELERKKTPVIDEEKIRNDVATELASKYDVLKNQLESDLETRKEEGNAKKQALSEDFESDKTKTNNNYDSARNITENDALKRGLARSSIVLEKLYQIESGRARELSEIQNNLTKSLMSVEKDLENLEQQRNLSLDELDLKKASEISEEIEKRKTALEELESETIEYNNKMEQIEKEFNLDAQSNKNKIDESNADAIKKKESDWRKSIASEKADSAIQYLNQFKRSDALNMLATDKYFAEQLGSEFMRVYTSQISR